MNVFRIAPVVVLLASVQAVAYDGFETDFSTCTQSNDSGAVVAACSRLIDNAAAENSVVGMLYGLRAANNTDAAQNCFDAKKSLALAEDDAIKSLSQQLIDQNC
ncbi:MAG: hypothetical protein P8Y82_04085 [Methyloceanibacter sp.]|jgi:hypothetical protein